MRDHLAHQAVGASDELIDRYLDGDLLPDESADLFKALRGDPEKSREFRDLQLVIDALGSPVDAPDLTRAVLTQVDRRRGLLDVAGRRRVAFGRLAAAACLLFFCGGLYTLHRFAPAVAAPGVEADHPIAHIEASVRRDSARVIDSIQHDLAGASPKLRHPEQPAQAEIRVAINDPDADRPFGLTSADFAPAEAGAPEIDPLVARAVVAVEAAPHPAPRTPAPTPPSTPALPQSPIAPTAMTPPPMPLPVSSLGLGLSPVDPGQEWRHALLAADAVKLPWGLSGQRAPRERVGFLKAPIRKPR